MGGVEILLFLVYTTFSNVHASSNLNHCPGSDCGNLYINYPFKQEAPQLAQDDCTYIDIYCDFNMFNGTTAAIVRLPHAGDFYISEILYDVPYIKLADPENCLMQRFMNNLNLSSSLLKAMAYENYTFYTCPTPIIEHNFFPIVCLSNTTNSTVATAIATPDYMSVLYGCQLIGSWVLPVLSKGQFEFEGTDIDLFLTWDSSTSCMGCDEQQRDKAGESNWNAIVSSPFFLPFFVTTVMLIMVCIRCIVGRNESNDDVPATAVQSASASALPARGLDESKINCCTELVILSESIITSPGIGSRTCSICLESYHPQELVRSIAKCGHSFHADCIQQWLIKSTTCPVCRTILSVENSL